MSRREAGSPRIAIIGSGFSGLCLAIQLQKAGIRSFRNHFNRVDKKKLPTYDPVLRPVREKQLENKTLVVPNFDRLSLRLVVANLRRTGIDARLLEENPVSIQKSLRYNNGQCIPLNIIAQEFIDFVKTRQLDPGRIHIW